MSLPPDRVSAAVPAPSQAFVVTFPAVPSFVPAVRRALTAWCKRKRLGIDDRFAIVYAGGEALANAVEHAYDGATGTARLIVAIDDARVRICVEDDGSWKPRVVSDERGRGFPIMQALMDVVSVGTSAAGKSVRLERTLDRELTGRV